MTNSESCIDLAISHDDLNSLLHRQLSFFAVKESDLDKQKLAQGIEIALTRVARCFSQIRNKYYSENGIPRFDPSHTGQYAIFLYYLSHSLHAHVSGGVLPAKVYALNKMLHCLDIFYEVELPDVFYLDHPVGSVIGRASFSDYFRFRQNCTVGNNYGKFPRFGRNVQLWSGVTMIGDCDIGDNVVFGSGTFVKNANIPSGSIVFGRSPKLIIKDKNVSSVVVNGKFLIMEVIETCKVLNKIVDRGFCREVGSDFWLEMKKDGSRIGVKSKILQY